MDEWRREASYSGLESLRTACDYVSQAFEPAMTMCTLCISAVASSFTCMFSLELVGSSQRRVRRIFKSPKQGEHEEILPRPASSRTPSSIMQRKRSVDLEMRVRDCKLSTKILGENEKHFKGVNSNVWIKQFQSKITEHWGVRHVNFIAHLTT
jgi:hypothetical protein